MREFTAIYPDSKDFVNSTAAARVNGYLARNGSLEMLQEELERLGLSESAKQQLLQFVNPNQ